MKNFENAILERYHIDVNSVRKTRSGFLCDTQQGLYKLAQVEGSIHKLEYTQYICKNLIESGFTHVDQIMRDKENKIQNSNRELDNYVLKQWYMGRECDVRRNNEILEGARVLGVLHKSLDEVAKNLTVMQTDLEYDSRWDDFVAPNLEGRFRRRNRCLKKAHSFMRKRVGKGEYERLYLNKFDDIYDRAQGIAGELKVSGYNELYSSAIDKKSIVHGDYNYHNIMFVGPDIAVTNIDKFKIDVQVEDLYNYLRKIMEKRAWDVYLGADIIEAYENHRLLSQAECNYIKLRLCYPEKIWKSINYYYHSNKAFVPEKNVVKLKLAIDQLKVKDLFIEDLFGKSY